MQRGANDPARVLGVAVLVVAVLAALVVPRLLAPDLVGQAFPAPLPEPPAVGSCLNMSTDSVIVVPCGEPHTAEVVRTWRAGETGYSRPAIAVLGFPMGLGAEMTQSDGSCYDPVMAYLGVSDVNRSPRPKGIPIVNPDDLWIAIPPLPGARYLSAPADQGVGNERWSACVATALMDDATLAGSVRNIASTFDRSRPTALTDCLALGDQALAELRYVSCDNPHRIEMLGYFNPTQDMLLAGSAETGVTAEQIQAGCEHLAATMMDRSDPTHGGQLKVTAEALWTRAGSLAAGSSPATVGMQAGLVSPDCFAELTNDGDLRGTVIGLGDAPLPLG